MADDSYGHRGPRIYGVPPGTPQQPQWAVPLEKSDATPRRHGGSESPTVQRRLTPDVNVSSSPDEIKEPDTAGQRRQSPAVVQTRPAPGLRSKTFVRDMAQQLQNTAAVQSLFITRREVDRSPKGGPSDTKTPQLLSTDVAQSPKIVRREVDSPTRVITSDIKTPESPEFSKRLKGFPDLLRAWEKKNDDLNKKNDSLNKQNVDLNKKCEDMKKMAQGFRDKYVETKKEKDELFKKVWKPYGSQDKFGNQQPSPYDNAKAHQSQMLDQELGSNSPASNYYSEETDSANSQPRKNEPHAMTKGQDAPPTKSDKTRSQPVSVKEQGLTRPEGLSRGQVKTSVSTDTILELKVNLRLLPAIVILSQIRPDKYSIENAYTMVRDSMKIASSARKQHPALSEALQGRCWFYLGVCRVAKTILDGNNYQPEICFEKAAAKATGVYSEADKAEVWRAEWREFRRELENKDDNNDNSRPTSSSSSAGFWVGVKRLSGLSWAEKMDRRTLVVDEETEVGSPREGGRPRPQGLGIFFGGGRARDSREDRDPTPRPGLERIPTFSTMSGSAPQSTDVSPTSAKPQDSPKLFKPERVPTFASASSFNSQLQTPTDESFSPMPPAFQQQPKGKLMLGQQQERIDADDDLKAEAQHASRHFGGGAGRTGGDIHINLSTPLSFEAGDDKIDLGSASGSASSIPNRKAQSMVSGGDDASREPGIIAEDASLPAAATDRFKRHKSTASYVPPSFAAGAKHGPSSSSGSSSDTPHSASGNDADTSPTSATSSTSGSSKLLHRRKSSITSALSPIRAALATGRAGNTLDSLREAEEGQSPYRNTFGEERLVQRVKGAWPLRLYGNDRDEGVSPGGSGGGGGVAASPRAGFWGPEDVEAGNGNGGNGGETPRPNNHRHGHSS